MSQDAFEQYIAPARSQLGWWRPVAGLILILVCYVVTVIFVIFGWIAFHWVWLGDLHRAVESLGQLQGKGGTTIIAVMLLSFAGLWVGTAFTAQTLHGQSFSSVFAPPDRRPRAGLLRGFGLAAFFSGLSLLLAIAIVGPPKQSLEVGPWALMFLPLAGLVFIQATAEELVFRGYLLQQLAVRFRSPIAWAVLPSLLFGIAHAGNTDEGWFYYIAITAVTGITLATLVWRTGSLWPAIGMHIGVNVMSLTGVGAEGILSGTQLWLFPGDQMMLLLQLNLVTCTAMMILMLSPVGGWLAGGPTASR